MAGEGTIQDIINDLHERAKRVDIHGCPYRSTTESQHAAIDRALQHLANGGDPRCPKIINLLIWA